MGIFKCSFFNLLRSPGRTAVVVFILAISLGLGLTMFEVHDVTASQLRAISEKIGTDIFVSPVGYARASSGSVILGHEDITKIKDLAHVVSVQSSLEVAYSGNTEINTASPTYPDSGPVEVHPVQALSLVGLDPAIANPILRLRGGDATMTIVEGTYFDSPNTDANVMVVGQALAEKNNLQIGSTVDVMGTPVQVIGIYTTGQTDNWMIMPIAIVQRLYSLPGANGVAVVADNVNNVDSVAREIETTFDHNVDVFTATSDYSRIDPDIIGASNASRTGMLITFIVGAAVIMLAVFLVMRQRVLEIGIMKAIGASNWRIGLGFGLETLFICLASAAVGIVFSLIFDKKGLVGYQVTDLSAWMFPVAIGVAVALGLIASTIPVWYISRVRPAEVLRNE